MKWNKKVIDKPVEKENSALNAHLLGIVRKFKPLRLHKNIKANMLDLMDYPTRRLSEVALLDAERRKAEALTLIRRASFI